MYTLITIAALLVSANLRAADDGFFTIYLWSQEGAIVEDFSSSYTSNPEKTLMRLEISGQDGSPNFKSLKMCVHSDLGKKCRKNSEVTELVSFVRDAEGGLWINSVKLSKELFEFMSDITWTNYTRSVATDSSYSVQTWSMNVTNKISYEFGESEPVVAAFSLKGLGKQLFISSTQKVLLPDSRMKLERSWPLYIAGSQIETGILTRKMENFRLFQTRSAPQVADED